MPKTRYHDITDVPGVLVGHATNAEALTGCTVIVTKKGAVAGVDVRGAAPGTRETDLLRPGNLVQEVHAVLLAGGSAFGLAAADGVVRWLEEQNVGFDTGVARVPIVPAAVLFDLALGDAHVRPDAAMGYLACVSAGEGPVEEGNVGAGTGASVGHLYGMRRAMKSGLGSFSLGLGRGVTVGALAAVNAFGDVVDPATGQILAGTRDFKGEGFANTAHAMRSLTSQALMSFAARNTVLVVVATNARLDKAQANHLARSAAAGIARAVRPAHTMFDGDVVFALSTGRRRIPMPVLETAAADVVSEAVVRAVLKAKPAGGLPAAGGNHPQPLLD